MIILRWSYDYSGMVLWLFCDCSTPTVETAAYSKSLLPATKLHVISLINYYIYEILNGIISQITLTIGSVKSNWCVMKYCNRSLQKGACNSILCKRMSRVGGNVRAGRKFYKAATFQDETNILLSLIFYKHIRCEANDALPCSAEVRNEWSHTSIPHMTSYHPQENFYWRYIISIT
jgi:hypothetical protein